MQPRRGDRERVAPPGLHGNFIGPEFQGLRSPSARSTPGYRRSPLRGCMAISLGPTSRGCARLRLAPPLATLGRPSGAAWHWGRLRPRGCPRLRLAPPLATLGRPSGAALNGRWLSRGCARLRLAPPLATVGRPSGAAWHWGRLRPRGCARLRLAPPLATLGRPSGATKA